MKRRTIILGMLLSLALWPTASAEMTVREEDPPGGPFVRNDVKFNRTTRRTARQNSDIFIGGAFDWSGVGRETTPKGGAPPTSSRWGTMISGRFFATAAHLRPRPGNALEFYFNNDPRKVERVPIRDGWPLFDAEQHRQPGASGTRADGAIGMLQRPVSDKVQTYPIFISPTDGEMPDVEWRDRDYVIIFGISGTDPRRASMQKLGWQYPAWFSFTDKTVTYLYDSGLRYTKDFPPEKLANWAFLRLYDSGGPSFVVKGLAGPVIYGTNFQSSRASQGESVETAGDGPSIDREGNPLFSIQSLVGLWKEELRTSMDKNQSEVPRHLRDVPIFWSGVQGDYNGNFELDSGDLDIMLRQVHARRTRRPATGGYNWYLDSTSDGRIDHRDADQLIRKIFRTRSGDVDLDHDVDQDDLDVLRNNFNAKGAGWSEGDLNGDGTVDRRDRAIFDANYPFP